jgi:hypothetical protein
MPRQKCPSQFKETSKSFRHRGLKNNGKALALTVRLKNFYFLFTKFFVFNSFDLHPDRGCSISVADPGCLSRICISPSRIQGKNEPDPGTGTVTKICKHFYTKKLILGTGIKNI